MKKDIITFPDFQKLDVRVGRVISAEEVVGSTNLIRMMVDFGQDYGTKKIISGIAQWYPADNLKGKKFLFVANLAPKKMMGEDSDGMILCADTPEGPRIIPIDSSVTEGTVVR